MPKISSDLIAVFTGKNLENGMTTDGGSGHWKAREDRVREAQYLLCVRNRRETWSETDVAHGTAFLVARISGTVNSKYPGRIVICFSEYAEIDVADAWSICTKGQRYPVAYLDSDKVQADLNLKFDTLDWKTFSPAGQPASLVVSKTPAMDTQKMAIQNAKEMLSEALGVPQENIEISVRF